MFSSESCQVGLNNPRASIFVDILNSLSSRPHVTSQSREHIASLRHTLALGALIWEAGGMRHEAPVTLKGGLTETDIRRFTDSFTPKLDAPIHNLVAEELESTIVSISDCFNSSPSGSQQRSGDLHGDIQMQLAQIETLETEGDRAHDRIEQLIRKIHQIHPRLQQRLAFAVTKFPRNMATRNSANNDLLAMTIEASLVKVSLVRGQTHNTLYDYRFSKNPEFNMKRALVAAHAKLKEDERKMEEEEGALDRELADYQKLLDIVDGGGNVSFRQIIADSARVEKETEECRRDLRRLGWTGEN